MLYCNVNLTLKEKKLLSVQNIYFGFLDKIYIYKIYIHLFYEEYIWKKIVNKYSIYKHRKKYWTHECNNKIKHEINNVRIFLMLCN